MDLNATSAAAQQQHQQMLLDLQAQRLASSMDVPTLPDQVRQALRDLRCPVVLFGENPANVRDRLKLELAKRKVYAEHYGAHVLPEPMSSSSAAAAATAAQAEVEETKYTRAPPALIKVREKITAFSLQRAKERLMRERQLRQSFKALERKRKSIGKMEEEDDEEDENVDTSNTATIGSSLAESYNESCCQLNRGLEQASLAGSQYGDARPLSAIVTTYNGKHVGDSNVQNPSCVLTASWSATLQWWDGSSPTLDLWGRRRQAHEDRIMGVDLMIMTQHSQSTSKILAGTASIDLTAKLWTISETTTDTDMADSTSTTVKPAEGETDDDTSLKYQFEEVAHIQGHMARLCKIAFHPMGEWVATTSHDHTWRLWDIETACKSSDSSNNNNENEASSSSELLLQDGHADKVFGIGFHPDGSLCATTDYSGMIHVWDLRTGKTAMHYYGHAGRVLCAKFAPTNGFQLTTAGDDGCLKVWDLRHRRKVKGSGAPEPRRTIPAHSSVITQLEYTDNDECLVSSSFDGTAKIWSTRGDWKLLQTMEGHAGKVMGVGIVETYEDNNAGNETVRNCGVVTCGFDKTLKLWS